MHLVAVEWSLCQPLTQIQKVYWKHKQLSRYGQYQVFQLIARRNSANVLNIHFVPWTRPKLRSNIFCTNCQRCTAVNWDKEIWLYHNVTRTYLILGPQLTQWRKPWATSYTESADWGLMQHLPTPGYFEYQVIILKSLWFFHKISSWCPDELSKTILEARQVRCPVFNLTSSMNKFFRERGVGGGGRRAGQNIRKF